MRHFALTAVGRDRPGIVAGITAVLLAHEVNVEDSQMTILRGHFTMMLVVAAPDGADVDRLRAELGEAGGRLGLETILLSPIESLEPAGEPEPSQIVTVYGADHPGIVHGVASLLAANDVNIVDMSTRVVGEPGQHVYAMVMEVDLPAGLDPDDLAQQLEELAAGLEVSCTLHPSEADIL